MATIDTALCTARRIYVRTKFGEPIVGDLKALGAKWDAEAKAWWVGTAKRAKVEALLAGPAGLDARDPLQVAAKADMLEEAGQVDEAEAVRAAGPAKEDLSKARVYAQVAYKGKRYYVIAEQRDKVSGEPLRCRLTTLDGEVAFWADCAACELIKTYQPREVWDGVRYSNRTRTVFTTIGSLREFIAERKAEKSSGAELCAECGRGGDLIEDLEDGLRKHFSCCDIPGG